MNHRNLFGVNLDIPRNSPNLPNLRPQNPLMDLKHWIRSAISFATRTWKGGQVNVVNSLLWPGKYHQNGGFSMAMLVKPECTFLDTIGVEKKIDLTSQVPTPNCQSVAIFNFQMFPQSSNLAKTLYLPTHRCLSKLPRVSETASARLNKGLQRPTRPKLHPKCIEWKPWLPKSTR